MGIIDKSVEEEPILDGTEKRYKGKIIAIIDGEGGGYGFVSSKEIPYRRIFFHWSALVPDTKTFEMLSEGDNIEFTGVNLPDVIDPVSKEKKIRGWRALRIKVIE